MASVTDSSAPRTRPIGVGIIGANPNRGWAQWAHIPALMALHQFELKAVATTKLESARAAAEKFGVAQAYDNAEQLALDPDVDVVSVTVKVPYHEHLVRTALSAGKHVYCEWPLGNSVEQAIALADLADESGVTHIVGMQGTFQPGARYTRELISQGAIGQPLAVSVVAHTASAGQRTPLERMYSADPAAGDTALSVATGHILGALSVAVGTPRDVSGLVAAIHRQTTITETGETVPVSAPDQVVVTGQLENEAVFSMAVQGCLAPGAVGFTIRVVGSDATLLIRSAVPGAVHIVEWALAIARSDGSVEELPIPERFIALPPSVPTGRPRNVALVYRELASAIAEHRPARPNFRTAVRFHRMLEAIQRASDTGIRQTISPE